MKQTLRLKSHRKRPQEFNKKIIRCRIRRMKLGKKRRSDEERKKVWCGGVLEVRVSEIEFVWRERNEGVSGRKEISKSRAKWGIKFLPREVDLQLCVKHSWQE